MTDTNASSSDLQAEAETRGDDALLTPAIELGPLEDHINFHLRRAQETTVRAFGLSIKQPYKPGLFPTLLVIRLNPGLSQIDICRAIGRDKSTMSPLVRELVSDGLVARCTSETDRRSVTLRLTDKGEAVLDRLLVAVDEHEKRLDAILGDAKPEFIAQLRKLTAALS